MKARAVFFWAGFIILCAPFAAAYLACRIMTEED